MDGRQDLIPGSSLDEQDAAIPRGTEEPDEPDDKTGAAEGSVPLEVNPADAAEQAVAVPFDDDEDRPGS
ncbi:hypothetical protein BAY61_09055 [Prauserella marina]|uniref:Uncharacterized protein n=1 Tax=Prauserella marina TaxID=530584 RepID=A0A222VMX7_9PSEU|nr:hypothetical protein [Prauserella marina]ASR35103.1 hypothetical protein BAY61_09055 [Prauserella marina]PWV85143.1 hypothetical protein DES30_1011166 [Prauserella marina]SDC03798.1 hypothetical protein SAMN05421630_101172 [Prauserella marina]